MFTLTRKLINEKEALVVSNLGSYSLRDSFECGQCFRYQKLQDSDSYIEYMTVIGDELIFIAQEKPGELIFYGITDEHFEKTIVPYFSLNTDYGKIKNDIVSRTDSDWLKAAAESAKGIAIFKQDEWETLFSFIISQNNNIPRIRKIISEICGEYGVNLCLQKGVLKCPLGKIDDTPCDKNCKKCGICYTFPKPEDIVKNPEGLLHSKPGFRYKYLLDAATRVASGVTNLRMIANARTYVFTISELTKILGVGEKVASCTALFGFGNLEAFPIDVWMRRAIDEYFEGKLDPTTLGRYAGVAQQYIFHYIRNLSKQTN